MVTFALKLYVFALSVFLFFFIFRFQLPLIQGAFVVSLINSQPPLPRLIVSRTNHFILLE